MRSILLSSNPSFSFFYTKRKLVDTNTFFWIKVHRKFQYPKKILFVFFSFVMESLLWWSFVLLKRQKLLQPLGCLSRPLSLLLTLPPNCANFDQTKKEVIQQKRKSWMCHHFSFWFTMKECKKIKRISKIGLPRFLLTLKKGRPEITKKGKHGNWEI